MDLELRGRAALVESRLEQDRLYRLPECTGAGFVLPLDHILSVVSPTGGQVADIVAFNQADTAERIDSGRTLDYNRTFHLTQGNTLYSNRSSPMLEIIGDGAGRHDFLFAPCSAEMFRREYGTHDYRPNCLDNLSGALRRFGITADQIPTAFNAFMVVETQPGSGVVSIGPPSSRPGSCIRFKARMAVIIGLTACAAERANAGRLKPIDYLVSAPCHEPAEID